MKNQLRYKIVSLYVLIISALMLFATNKTLAADTCFQKTVLDIHAGTDSAGNCIFSAHVSVVTGNYIIGYQWSGGGPTEFHNNHTTSDGFSFTLPPGTGTTISVTIFAVDTNYKDTLGSPCCSETVSEKVWCDAVHVSCIDTTDATIKVITEHNDSLGCDFTCIASVSPVPGWTIVAYQWQYGPLTSSNVYTFTGVPYVSYPVNVVVYAVDSIGDTCTYSMSTTLDCFPDTANCLDTASHLVVSSYPGISDSCIFNVNVYAVSNPGWSVIGYQYGTGPIVAASSHSFDISTGTSLYVPVTIYALSIYGDTCSMTIPLTLNCDSGVGTYYRSTASNGGTPIKNVAAPIVFPNPSNGELNITDITGIEVVEIFNTNGKKVGEWHYSDSRTKAYIDIGKLPAGIYIVRLNGTKNTRVLKQ